MARKKAKKAKKTAKKAVKKTAAKKSAKKKAVKKTAAKRAPARKAKKATKRPVAKKATAKKAVKKTAAKKASTKDIKGEGNYSASRRFRKKEEGFIARMGSKIAELGHDAKVALTGPEGKELEAAEASSRARGEGMDVEKE